MSESSPAKPERPAAEVVPSDAPVNRAARRGKARRPLESGAGPERELGGRARSAQGRRINPIRRTG